MADAALRLEGVSKKFKKGEIYDSLRDLIPVITGRIFRRVKPALEANEFWALRDVSVEVAQGEAFGIIGQNGAGKSTILKLLSGIMQPTSGQIEVSGRLSALIEVGAGFHPDLTGRENVFLNGTILGMTRAAIQRKFDEIVAFSGLEEFIDTPVKRYSSGMYARLGFSVAAHVDPKVLIIDEVLSVGDFVFQNKCMRRMQETIESGATVIFVSHNLRAVAEFCGRSLLLEHGQVKAIGSTNDVIQQYMGRMAGERVIPEDQPAYISSVRIRGQDGETIAFESGAKAWVDVTIESRVECNNVTVVLGILDDQSNLIYSTSPEQLGGRPVSLAAGELYTVTFELTINMAFGTFHVSTYIYRFDMQKTIDSWSPSATIYVSTEDAVRGAVNCFARVVGS